MVIDGLVEAVRSGEMAPHQPAEAARERIGDDPLNAFTHIESASTSPGADGPLVGVPIAIKDLIDQAGRTTTCGSEFYRATPERSAPVVASLEAAGAVVVGRTGLHEFAFGFSSENDWFGPIRNPWDPTTSPGGSSGGSAVAVAAGYVPLAVGTDTGGSVRVPAAMCGIYGLKVTHGRIPLTGVFPLAPSLDTVGPLAGSAADLAHGYAAMIGFDPNDPWSRRPSASPTTRTTGRLRRPLRIGVPRVWIERAPTTPDVLDAFGWALDRLRHLGHDVTDLTDPDLSSDPLIGVAAGAEVAAVHGRWVAEQRPYGPAVATRVHAAVETTLEDFARARAWRARLRRAADSAFRTVDLVATPTVGAMRKVIGEDEITIEGTTHHYRSVLAAYTPPVNHLGVPAIALPLRHPGAPPPSLQLIGPAWSERLLLGVAADLEANDVVGFTAPPGHDFP